MAQEIRGKMDIAGIMGPVWFIGWLFTIGFAHLGLVKLILAVVIWPYYLGRTLG